MTAKVGVRDALVASKNCVPSKSRGVIGSQIILEMPQEASGMCLEMCCGKSKITIFLSFFDLICWILSYALSYVETIELSKCQVLLAFHMPKFG